MRPRARAGVVALLWLVVVPAAEADARPGTRDPVETVNRSVFEANMTLDDYALAPAARGWELVTPQELRLSIDRFFTNAAFGVRVVSTLLQGRPIDSGEELARFVVNVTMGFLGFFDPASSIGLDLHREDFGQTLAIWGIPEGPYLMLPFYGPSNGRDAFAFLVDSALSPRSYAAPIEIVNSRALLLDDVRIAREASLDFYAFARSAYREQRQNLIADDGRPREESLDDLYELDDELYELEDE